MKQALLRRSVLLTKPFNCNRLSSRSLCRVPCGSLLLVTIMGVSSVLAADVPLAFRNLGMEEGSSAPSAWVQGAPVPGVQLLWDQKTAHGGKASLCLKKTAQRYFPVAQWSQSLPVETASSPRKFRVRCWVKTEAVTTAIIDVPYQVRQQRGHAWAVFLGQKQPTDPFLKHD